MGRRTLFPYGQCKQYSMIGNLSTTLAARLVVISEDALFELTLSAALGAGMARLEPGLKALQGGEDATQNH